jgi:peroxiredoxin
MNVPYVTSYVVLWVLVLFQGLMIVALARAVYRLESIGGPLDRGEGVGLRSRPAPEFEAVAADGTTVRSDELRGRRWALLFVSPSCPACLATLDELQALKSKVNDNVIVVNRAPLEESRQLARTYGLDVPVVPDEFATIGDLFTITRHPMAVLVNEEYRIESQGEPKRGAELEAIFAERNAELAATT